MASVSRKKRILPGFRLAMGFTLFYLVLIVLIPLSTLFFKTATLSFGQFWEAVASPRTLAAFRLSFGASLVAALVNVPFGLLVAWVLARYDFPGKDIADALVDLPFALPTAVAGIALTALYAPTGWIGQFFFKWGIKTAFNFNGIVIALIFIGFPFIVRTVQPVLEELDPAIEEAAASLGADRLQTFLRVIFPAIFPSLLAGFTMAFARAVGEYGSVIFIAGNMPMKTEIAALLIMTKLEQFDYAGATAIAVVMLVASFLFFLLIHRFQAWGLKRAGMEA